jgi:two-component sensor histidine kinase
MLGANALAQQVYPYLNIEIEDYRLRRHPKNSESRYNLIIELVIDVEKYRENKAPYNINRMPASYLNVIEEAQIYAVDHKKWDHLKLVNNHEFDHYLHYKSRTNGILLANKLLRDTLRDKNTFKIQLYSYLSTAYQDLGLNNEFIALIPKMYALKREMNDDGAALGNQEAAVANSYFLNKNYDIAIKYYKRALTATRMDRKNTLAVQIHNKIGQSFSHIVQVDSAVTHYNMALTLLQQNSSLSNTEDKDYLLYLYNQVSTNKAELLYIETAPEKVTPYALKTFHTFPNQLNPVELASTYNLLGKLYYATGDYPQAEAYLIMAREKLVPGVNAQDHIDNLKTEAQIALVKGDKKQSAILFKKQERFEDSIAQLKTDTRMAIALTAYDTQEKEIALKVQELRIATQENELDDQKQQRLLYFILIGGFLIVVVLGSFYIVRIRKQKQQITSQKVALDESLLQKELLLKEVHHRVKNNLQIVSSLLEVQADKTNDTTAKSIMSEGQDRIDAMALIHQQLYQSQDFKNIDLQNYVENLFEHLYMSHNKQDIHITQILEIDVDPVDIDVAVPFGIILNELVSNCYKYAFKGRDEGIINVVIRSISDTHNELIVKDNGVGLSKDFESRKKQSLGMTLIEGIAWQLRGKLTYTSSSDGSKFSLLFIKNLAIIQE